MTWIMRKKTNFQLPQILNDVNVSDEVDRVTVKKPTEAPK